VTALPATPTTTDAPAPGAPASLTLAVGADIGLVAASPVATVLQLSPRLDDRATLVAERWDLDVEHSSYVDVYGNRCERLVVPAGTTTIRYAAEVQVSPGHDEARPEAREIPPAELPDEVLAYVLPSRYCLPDELGDEAWRRFGGLAPGWSRVQAVVDFVHSHVTFAYGSSTPTTTAADVHRARTGVCRDFAHLAISFCRALNIPARYVFGYIPDIGVPPPDTPMDYCAWFEAYLEGGWYTFDARLNQPRIGRVVVGRGRDAVDVAMITSYGPLQLSSFTVQAEPLGEATAS
jgi:transglutaminase-like putative cysteine protease